jgi:hypothetical protein
VIAAIILANFADLATFICAASVLPIEGEGNPLARWAYIHHGLLGVVALKLVGVTVVVGVLSGVADSPGKAIVASILVALPLIGALTNTAAVVLSRN